MTTKHKDILEMNYSELVDFWDDYKEGLASWGGYLKTPYPELLTTWYAERVIDYAETEDKSKLTAYDTVIPASEFVILAAYRHMKDLERQGTDEFPWVFDESKGHRPIRFLEKKCKPSKGEAKTLTIQPWQHFVIGSIYGWVHRDSGIRRFREALDFVGRKNGKTTKVSGLSNYMLGEDGENGANIYILANSQKQSRILFNESKAMVDASPYLSKKFKALQSEIRYPKMNCTMVALSAEKNNKDGENLSFGCFDEVNEYKNFTLINVMKRSRAMRLQPLIMYITTAGYVLDGPLMDMYEQGVECLENYDDHIDERTFYFLAQLDHIDEADDPNTWIKANPNLCLMDFVSLVTDYKKDRKSPQEYADWITKQFNIFSDIDELPFVSVDTIEKNTKKIDIDDLLGKTAVGGYDLSDTEDFTSAVLEFPLDTGEIYIMQHTFMPQSRYNRDSNQQRLDMWIKNGDVTIIPGDYVDKDYVLDWFVEKSKLYKIIKITYDPAKALSLNKSLESYGFDTEIVRQGFLSLGGPMQNFKEMMLDGKVIFNNSKIFRWYLNNVKLVKDRNNNWMPTKQSKNRKIDGFAASLNAHVHIIDMLITPQGPAKVTHVSVSDLLNLARR